MENENTEFNQPNEREDENFNKVPEVQNSTSNEDATGACSMTPKAKRCHGWMGLINVLMLIGLIVLYILFFTSKGDTKHNPNATAPITGDGQLKIAYVNTDTLMAKYQYAIDLNNQLKAYQQQQENSYKQQMTQFQNDYQKYLKEGPDMTLSQQRAKEEELQKRMQRLQSLEGELALKIQEKTLKESETMTRAVYAFIREYNKDNQQFDLILAKSFSSSPILYGNEGMDITNEIVEGLNKEYTGLKDNKTEKDDSTSDQSK